MALPEIHIEPEAQNQHRSLRATIALRIGATILGVFLGFAFYIGSYLDIIIVDSELLGLQEYIITRLSISVLLWTLLGLLTPFRTITQTFKLLYEILQGSSGKAISLSRLIILLAVLLILLFLYWFILGFIAEITGPIFSE
jgi:hypothetical protein